MVCLYCGAKTQVTNSRPSRRLNQTWRRRGCDKCGAIFTTRETIDYAGSIVVKHAALIEPFDRDILLLSLVNSLGHRMSPVADARALVDTIMQKLVKAAQNGSMKASDITAVTSAVLARFDSLAAAHYKAYHQES